MQFVQEFIGADLSKATIDIAFPPAKAHLRISNSKEGYPELLRWLKQLKLPTTRVLIVMEHTGLYSLLLERFLHQHHIAFTKVSALEIKRSMGLTRGKTDKVDADRIASYAAEKRHKLKVCEPVTERLQRLKLLRSSRGQLVKQRTATKCVIKELRNIKIAENDLVLKVHLKILATFEQQIKKLENEIELSLAEDDALLQNYQLLMSIKGVGKVLALATLVKTENFSRFANSRKFACYCGTAPFEHSSGSSIRGRTRVSHLADKEMKCLLELSARSAIQFNPEMKAYYQRRLEEGKSKTSTLNIIRNKIIHRMFAIIKRQEPYALEYKIAV